MFIMTENINQRKVGDVVPNDLAKLWIFMYKFPPVKEAADKQVDQIPIIPKVIVSEPHIDSSSKVTKKIK